MYNRILKNSDLNGGIDYIKEGSKDSNHKHKLWTREDSTLKWTTILKSRCTII